jgi:hypothetical protein
LFIRRIVELTQFLDESITSGSHAKISSTAIGLQVAGDDVNFTDKPFQDVLSGTVAKNVLWPDGHIVFGKLNARGAEEVFGSVDIDGAPSASDPRHTMRWQQLFHQL